MQNQIIRLKQLQLFQFQLSSPKYGLFKPKNTYVLKIMSFNVLQKDILNNVKPNSKAQATATFSISALISEKWAFKAKKCWYFWNKGPNKKSVLRKKVLKSDFLVFSDGQKEIIFY